MAWFGEGDQANPLVLGKVIFGSRESTGLGEGDLWIIASTDLGSDWRLWESSPARMRSDFVCSSHPYNSTRLCEGSSGCRASFRTRTHSSPSLEWAPWKNNSHFVPGHIPLPVRSGHPGRTIVISYQDTFLSQSGVGTLEEQ